MNKRQWRKRYRRIYDFCVTNYEREGGYNIIGWNEAGNTVFAGYRNPFKTLEELDKFLRGITKVKIIDVSAEEEKQLWGTGARVSMGYALQSICRIVLTKEIIVL